MRIYRLFPKKAVIFMSSNTSAPVISTPRLCFCALFAALACAGTFIAVPLPIGYFNLGDIFVLCAAWCLGPVPGALAAGLGSALADIIMGYVLYAPATFLIKGCTALLAGALFRALFSALKTAFPARLLSAVVGEAVMVGGYFVFEAVFMGYGMGASVSVPGNLLQAACGVCGAVMLISVLQANRTLRRYLTLN